MRGLLVGLLSAEICIFLLYLLPHLAAVSDRLLSLALFGPFMLLVWGNLIISSFP